MLCANCGVANWPKATKCAQCNCELPITPLQNKVEAPNKTYANIGGWLGLALGIVIFQTFLSDIFSRRTDGEFDFFEFANAVLISGIFSNLGARIGARFVKK